MNAVLFERFSQLKQQHPSLRARGLAQRLGVTEAELVACQPTTQLLQSNWRAWLHELVAVGPVMALTRNDAVVMEKTEPFESVECDNDHVAGVYGQAIDLRLFFGSWRHLFFVEGERPSFQSFDRFGVATLKVFAVEGTEVSVFRRLADALQMSEDQKPAAIEIEPTTPAAPASTAQPDSATFNRAWREMTSPHDFFSLLQRFSVSRMTALHLADADLVWPISPLSHRELFGWAAETAAPVMIFVANGGATQIHSGPIQTLKTVGHWFNILDPHFNLHLQETAIHRAFVVRKPLRDGWTTGVEFYDAREQLMFQLFGERKRGESEPLPWRNRVHDLAQVAA